MILSEIQSRGTYIAVNPVGSTRALLQEWMLDNPVPNPVFAHELHVTVLASRVAIRPALSTNEFHADASQFKIFENDIGVRMLVIALDAPEITQRHQYFRRLGATHNHALFTPHLTISYDVGDFDFSNLDLPHFHLLFCGEFSREMRD